MEVLLNEITLKSNDGVDLKPIDFVLEKESKEYKACRFLLNGKRIISRTSKITPKKKGQFVTFYKRNNSGVIEPFFENDSFDFFLVNAKLSNQLGVFVFPKSVLIHKGIISTKTKEGKRAFRVYSPWDVVDTKQALATQKWQFAYFYDLKNILDQNRFAKLF
ncbi:MepB family protein [Wenyingzhuangia fucanilytica]|uniref:MepB family protein n=1 Tax=Wenyingzhuangia fucanilytica TaxID=1790137 RepID=A0A1B1Y8L0_9FLAO|nr:MepB family protein [Wenyingzhuangia fucanilytica]ANW97107.1 MepB family protein [Wenyingzhuangia fucanilytica]